MIQSAVFQWFSECRVRLPLPDLKRSSYRDHDAGGMMGEAYHTTAAADFITDQHPD